MRAAAENNTRSMGVNDKWIFIDQDSVPVDAENLAGKAATIMREATGKIDLFVAVDLVWTGERWLLLELNHEAMIQHHSDPEAE